jgi:hypothetical protein
VVQGATSGSMMLREEDAGAFKQWLLPKLETMYGEAIHQYTLDMN